MKKAYKIFSVLFYLLIFVLLLSSFTATILKRPLLFTAIRSNSMYPLYEKGDIGLIIPAPKSSYKIGDIIVFEGEDELGQKKLIMHRIVEGDLKEGFITKGDANDLADQEQGFKRVKPESVFCKAVVMNNTPIKLPLLGHIPLWMENLDVEPSFFPLLTLILIVIVILLDIFKKPGKQKTPKLDTTLLCFAVGLSLSILMGTTILSGCQNLIMPYEVSESQEGALMGSSIGVIKKGDTIKDKHISTVSNKGAFPLLVSISCNDEQITFILEYNPKMSAKNF